MPGPLNVNVPSEMVLTYAVSGTGEKARGASRPPTSSVTVAPIPAWIARWTAFGSTMLTYAVADKGAARNSAARIAVLSPVEPEVVASAESPSTTMPDVRESARRTASSGDTSSVTNSLRLDQNAAPNQRAYLSAAAASPDVIATTEAATSSVSIHGCTG